MPIKVSATEKRPTHDISLEDESGNKVGLILTNINGARNPLGISSAPLDRTAFKTTTGSVKYSDFEMPWTTIAQTDFSGGLGSEDFEVDQTKFLENRRTNPSLGYLMLGPRDSFTKGIRNQNFLLPGSLKWVSMFISGENKYIANKFTATAYTATSIYLHVRRVGTPLSPLTITLHADDSGSPHATVLKTATITTTNITDIEAEFYKATITGEALTGAAVYWIKINSASGDEENHWEVGCNNAVGTTKVSANGTTWATTTFDMYFRIAESMGSAQIMFFQYKRALYAISNPTSGAPSLYISGDRGVADANTGALTTLVDATKAWATDAFAGATALIISGTGMAEQQPYRTIASNTADTLTLSSPWTITHDTTTEYVIIGSDVWTPYTADAGAFPAHGLTVPVTSVLVVNNIVYFGQGEAVNMRRMQWTQTSNAELYAWAADSTNKASYLCGVYDSSDGLTIWKGNNAYPPSIAKSVIKAWGTDLAFGTAISMPDDYGNITGMIAYGSPELLYVMREGMIFYQSAGKILKMQLDELRTVMETKNCSASCVSNVYMLFSLGNSLEQYYSSEISDIGPNRDAGLPSARQGQIVKLVSYPGKIYAAIDAGTAGVSSVLCRYGSGWSEFYRAPTAGERIQDIIIQPIPGSSNDRMYVAIGNDIVWLAMPSYAESPDKDPVYKYIHEGSLTTGWIYANMYDVIKLWHSFKMFSENLTASGIEVAIDYMCDDDTEWITLSDKFTKTPSQELGISQSGLGVAKYRVRCRLRLISNNVLVSPKVKTLVLENVSRIPVKFAYSIMYRAKDGDLDLNELADDYALATEKQAVIKNWFVNIVPLIMRSRYSEYDNAKVFIDPTSSGPIAVNGENFYYKMVLTQI